MSKIDDFISDVKTRKIGTTSRRALIVEGPDDVDVFRAFLNKRRSTWEQDWVIVPAGGKRKVLDVLDKESSWLGVIDQDEWSLVQVNAELGSRRNLHVLPRFCIESYFVDPAEIWPALPPIQQAKVQGGAQTLHQHIETNLADWIRHAALWQVIHPLYMGMRDSGNRDSLLDPANVPNFETLTASLSTWLSHLQPQTIAQNVSDLEQSYVTLPKSTFYAKHLYSKKFFPMVVHTTLNELLGQQPERERIQDLLRTLPLPSDLAPLWVRMGI